MTIAISLKVNDGLVLAADSATTIVQQAPGAVPLVVNVYDNANKVFNVVRGAPVGAITWGAGSIGNASTSTLLKDFRRRLEDGDPPLDGVGFDPGHFTVADLAARLRRFLFEERYVPAFAAWPATAPKPTLGFIVAGYSSGEDLAEEYQVLIENGACGPPRLLRRKGESGMTWNGEQESITRLIRGYGLNLPVVLEQNLGVPREQVGPAVTVIGNALQAPLIVPAMPIQDAIDLARFLVETAIQFSRFLPGPQTVGGPVEIAAISKHEGFKWVQRKHYYSQELNPRGQDRNRRREAGGPSEGA